MKVGLLLEGGAMRGLYTDCKHKMKDLKQYLLN